MTWVDGVVLAVLAFSAIIAFFRGMVREVLGVGAWIGAVLAALVLRNDVAALFGDAIDPPWVAEAVAAAAVFLTVLIVLKVLIGAIANRVQDSMLGGLDRALGLVFGLARGAFLVIAAYILGGMLIPATEQWPPAVRDARFLPHVVEGAEWLAEQLPPGIRPGIAAPPARPGPSQDDLMRPPARNRT
ncbi:MAG: CvpA family protein [Acetobacteraceae bacterium]|nr:CvpA family protein [Acetobacteraceae bacterium]